MSEPGSPVARLLRWLTEIWNEAPPALRRHWPWFIAGGVVVGFLLVILLRPAGPEEKHEAGEGETTAAAGGAGGGHGAAGAASGVTPSAPPPLAPNARHDAGPPLSPNVKLTFKTFPARKASVTWGSKRLGFTDRGKPLVIERPRDSGPLDVTVRSQGFVTVHARVYTFDDSVLEVKITPVEKKDTLYGYQQPLADAGVP